MFYGIRWNLLNKLVVRSRPLESISDSGSVVISGEVTQSIYIRVKEIQPRRYEFAEKESPEGLRVERSFHFSCNYFTDRTLAVPTDLQLGDSVTFADATGSINCRVVDMHDAAGQGHHIYGMLKWISPVGDVLG